MRIMFRSVCFSIWLAFSFTSTFAADQVVEPGETDEAVSEQAREMKVAEKRTGAFEDEQDPKNQLRLIEERNKRLVDNPENGLIPYSPIQPLRDGINEWKEALYGYTNLRVGLAFHTVYANATPVRAGFDRHGWATDMDVIGSWELLDVGKPTQGELFFGIEGRWNYGTQPPQDIGFVNLASAGGIANTYTDYDPTFILRNFYWRQGGPEAGWAYRIGKITVDQIFGISKHLSPVSTFLPNGGTGVFTNALPDSGLGAVGVLYFDDFAYLSGGISDANADRFNWGDISKGDFYKVAELGVRLLPMTTDASYSKFGIWHNDGTSDGSAINGMTGVSGWGYYAILQQELTSDGNLVAVLRYGQGFNGSAVYDRQAGVHLVWYQPSGWFDSEALGVAVNWFDSSAAGARDEVNIEAFYRFPLLPDVDTTLSYQHVHHPALTREIDSADVFLMRFTTSF